MQGKLAANRAGTGPARARAGRAGRTSLVVRASGNTFGHMFRVTTFGESHGKGVGCVIDGVPPRLALTEADIQVRFQCTIYNESCFHPIIILLGQTCARTRGFVPALFPPWFPASSHSSLPRSPIIPPNHCRSSLGRAQPPEARPEPHHHSPEGGRRGRDPVGRLQRYHPGHAHRRSRPEQGPALGGERHSGAHSHPTGRGAYIGAQPDPRSCRTTRR